MPDVSGKTGRRDLAFMILLYSTAARMDELLDMKVGQINLNGNKPYANIIGKGNKVRTLYLLPKTVAHLEQYLREFHGKSPDLDAYLFYSRNTGLHGKMSQPAIDKFLKKYAAKCHEECPDIPLNLHAHMFRHGKASHWLEDGMNIVQISFLLGHENLQTTMIYLEVTTENVAEALATHEEEKYKAVTPKWKSPAGSLVDFCGVRF
jgi:site-specific recombinase XerD